MTGIWLLSDKDIEDATKSVCDGRNLWLMVKRGKDGCLWKSWAFLYRSPETGKRREMGLGSVMSVTPDQARASAKQAHDWLKEVPAKDPITERMGVKKRNIAVVGATVDKEIAKYIERVLPSYPEDFRTTSGRS